MLGCPFSGVNRLSSSVIIKLVSKNTSFPMLMIGILRYVMPRGKSSGRGGLFATFTTIS